MFILTISPVFLINSFIIGVVLVICSLKFFVSEASEGLKHHRIIKSRLASLKGLK